MIDYFRYWQAIKRQKSVNFGANFRAYHSFSRNPDYLKLFDIQLSYDVML